ncbi:MAG: hypothetical protein JRG69_13255 [Deltaproteobacteria bacterium]|nr:hypothetical protein [Deltaproteobacteria bacterium]
MGVYTYTLRTKTQNVELPSGEIVAANIMSYLCRSNDHDTSWMWPGDYGYKYACVLKAQIESCQARWRYHLGPIYIIVENSAIYRADDPSKACVWYDCDDMAKADGVTLVGLLDARVRRGRKLAWTIKGEINGCGESITQSRDESEVTHRPQEAV